MAGSRRRLGLVTISSVFTLAAIFVSCGGGGGGENPGNSSSNNDNTIPVKTYRINDQDIDPSNPQPVNVKEGADVHFYVEFNTNTANSRAGSSEYISGIDCNNDGNSEYEVEGNVLDYTCNYPEEGNYNARIYNKRTDGSDETNIYQPVNVARNFPPRINSFTANPQQGEAPLTVTYSYSVSDQDGDSLTCKVDYEGDGSYDEVINNCQQGTLTHTFDSAGTYNSVLKVSDGKNETTETLTIDVHQPPVNHAPTINSLTANPTSGTAPLTVTYNYAVSDQDGDTLTCEVDYEGDGIIDKTIADCSSGSFTHTFSLTGTYHTILNVSDGDKETSKTITISVSQPPVNHAPVVNFGITPNAELGTKQFYTGENINGHISANDQDGDTLTIYVDRNGDGNADQTFTCNGGSCEQDINLSYAQAGNYNIKVWASDGQATSNIAQDQVEIYKPLQVGSEFDPNVVGAGAVSTYRAWVEGGIGEKECDIYHRVDNEEYKKVLENVNMPHEGTYDTEPLNDGKDHTVFMKVVCKDERNTTAESEAILGIVPP